MDDSGNKWLMTIGVFVAMLVLLLIYGKDFEGGGDRAVAHGTVAKGDHSLATLDKSVAGTEAN